MVKVAYQAERLGNERPHSQKATHDEAAEDGFDLGNTAVLRVDGIFLDKYCREDS